MEAIQNEEARMDLLLPSTYFKILEALGSNKVDLITPPFSF